MKTITILLVLLVLLPSCAESAAVDLYAAPDVDGDTDTGPDTETDTDTDGDTDTDWVFDCARACDAEAVCGAMSSTYSGWDACFDGCEASLATDMNEAQEEAVACVWFDCVLESEAGDLPCAEWVPCIHACTQWLFG